MKKIALTAFAALGAMALPAAAHAQSNDGPEITVGASVGLHDLGIENNTPGLDVDDSGEIYGGFAAVDFPIGGSLFIGGEGNLHLGSGPINSEYGASARLGYRTSGGGKVYLRGGYQWVDIDVPNLLGVPASALAGLPTSNTEGDYLVGGGVEFPIGGLNLRANVDTVAFDTLRGTVGIGLRF